jgi:hypothetical protein
MPIVPLAKAISRKEHCDLLAEPVARPFSGHPDEQHQWQGTKGSCPAAGLPGARATTPGLLKPGSIDLGEVS